MKLVLVSRVVFFLTLLLLASPSLAGDNLINVRSQYDVPQTLDRFEAAAKQTGLKIIARIDHAKGAKSVGKELRPTELIIFGDPKLGTGMMSSNQRAGIVLPMKALAWQDAKGVVWLSYTNTKHLFARFDIVDRPYIKHPMIEILVDLAKAATQP
ncbi:MAG: DUF302 domain-containing protein [Pseudomonadota bacterium]